MPSANSSLVGQPQSKGDAFIELVLKGLYGGEVLEDGDSGDRGGMGLLPADIPPLPTKYSSYRFRKLTDHHVPQSMAAAAIAGTTGEGNTHSDFAKVSAFLLHQQKSNPTGMMGSSSASTVTLGQLGPSSPHCSGWEQGGVLKGIFGGAGGASATTDTSSVPGGGAASSSAGSGPPGMRKKKSIRDKFVILNEIAEQCDVAMSLCTQEAKYALRNGVLLAAEQQNPSAPAMVPPFGGVQSVAEHIPETHREALIFFHRHTHLCFLVYRLYIRHLNASQSSGGKAAGKAASTATGSSSGGGAAAPESVSTFFASMKQVGGNPLDTHGLNPSTAKKGFSGAVDIASPLCASCAVSSSDMFNLHAPVQDGTAAVNDVGMLLTIPKPTLSSVANHNEQFRRRAEDCLSRPLTHLIDLLTDETVVAACRRAPCFVALTPLFYAPSTSMQGLVTAATTSLNPGSSDPHFSAPEPLAAPASMAAFGATLSRFTSGGISGEGGRGKDGGLGGQGASGPSSLGSLDFVTALGLLRILRLITHALSGDFERLMPLVTIEPHLLEGGATNTLEQLVMEAAATCQPDLTPRKNPDHTPRASHGAQLLLRYQLLQAVLWEIQSLCCAEGLDHTLKQQAQALRLDVLSFRMGGAAVFARTDNTARWADAFSGSLARNLIHSRNVLFGKPKRWAPRVSPARSVEASLVRSLDWTYAVLSYPGQGTALPTALLKMLSQTNDGITTNGEVTSSSNSSFSEDPTANSAAAPSQRVQAPRRTLLRLSFGPACTLPLQALAHANLHFSLVTDPTLSPNMFAASSTVIAPHAMKDILAIMMGEAPVSAGGAVTLVKRLAKILHLSTIAFEDGIFGFDYYSVSTSKASGICVRPAVLVGESGEGCVVPFELQTVSCHEYSHPCFLALPGSPGAGGYSLVQQQESPAATNNAPAAGSPSGDGGGPSMQQHFSISANRIASSTHPLSNYFHKRPTQVGGPASSSTSLVQWLNSLPPQQTLQAQLPLLVADNLGHADQQGLLVGRGGPTSVAPSPVLDPESVRYFPIATTPFAAGTGLHSALHDRKGDQLFEDPFLLAELYHCGSCADADPFVTRSAPSNAPVMFSTSYSPTSKFAIPAALDLVARLPRHVASQLSFQQLLLAPIRSVTHSAAIRHLTTLSPSAQSILFAGLSPSYFPAMGPVEVKSSPSLSYTPLPIQLSNSSFHAGPGKNTEQKWTGQAAVDSLVGGRMRLGGSLLKSSLGLSAQRWASFVREHLLPTLYPHALHEACSLHAERIQQAANDGAHLSFGSSVVVDGFRSAGPHPRLHDAALASITFSLAFTNPTLNESCREVDSKSREAILAPLSRDLRVSLFVLASTLSHVGSETSLAHPLQGSPTFSTGSGRPTPSEASLLRLQSRESRRAASGAEPSYTCIHPSLVPSDSSVASLLWLLHQQRPAGSASLVPTSAAPTPTMPPLTESDAQRSVSHLWLETSLLHVFLVTRLLEPLPVVPKAVAGLSLTRGNPAPAVPQNPGASPQPQQGPTRCLDLASSLLFKSLSPSETLLHEEATLRKRLAHEHGHGNSASIPEMLLAGGASTQGRGQMGAPADHVNKLYGHSVALSLPTTHDASSASILRAAKALEGFIQSLQRRQTSSDAPTCAITEEVLTSCEPLPDCDSVTNLRLGGVRRVPLSDYLGVLFEGSIMSLGTPGTLQSPSDEGSSNRARIYIEEGLRVVDEFSEMGSSNDVNIALYRNEHEHLSFLNLMVQAAAWGFHGAQRAQSMYGELTENSAALSLIAIQAKGASALDIHRRKERKMARLRALLTSAGDATSGDAAAFSNIGIVDLPDSALADDRAPVDSDEQLFNHLYPYLYSPYCSPVYAYYTTRSPTEDAAHLELLRAAKASSSPSGLNQEPSSMTASEQIPLCPPPKSLQTATPITGLHRLLHSGVFAHSLAAASLLAPGGSYFDTLLQEDWEQPSARWTGAAPLQFSEESGAVSKMLTAAGDLASAMCIGTQDVSVVDGAASEAEADLASPRAGVSQTTNEPSHANHTHRHIVRLNQLVREALSGRTALTKEAEREAALQAIVQSALELRFVSPPPHTSSPNVSSPSSPGPSSPRVMVSTGDHMTLAAAMGEAMRDVLVAHCLQNPYCSSGRGSLTSVAGFSDYVRRLLGPLSEGEDAAAHFARLRASVARGSESNVLDAVRAEQMQRSNCAVGFLVSSLLGVDVASVDALLGLDVKGGANAPANPSAGVAPRVASSLYMLARGLIFSRSAFLRTWKADNCALLSAKDPCAVLTALTQQQNEGNSTSFPPPQRFVGHPALLVSLAQTEALSSLLGAVASCDHVANGKAVFSSRSRKAATQALAALTGELGELIRITSTTSLAPGVSFTTTPNSQRGGSGIKRIEAAFPSLAMGPTDSPFQALLGPTLETINGMLWTSTATSIMPSKTTLQSYLVHTPQGAERHIKGARSTHPLALNSLAAPEELPTVELALSPQQPLSGSHLQHPSPHTLFAHSWGSSAVLQLNLVRVLGAEFSALVAASASPNPADAFRKLICRTIKRRICKGARVATFPLEGILSEELKAITGLPTNQPFDAQLRSHLWSRLQRALAFFRQYLNQALADPNDDSPASLCDVVQPIRDEVQFPLEGLTKARYVIEGCRALCSSSRAVRSPVALSAAHTAAIAVPALMSVINTALRLRPRQPEALRVVPEAKGVLAEVLMLTSRFEDELPYVASASSMVRDAISLPSELLTALSRSLNHTTDGDEDAVCPCPALQWVSCSPGGGGCGDAEVLARRFTAALHPLASSPSLLTGSPQNVAAMVQAQSVLSGMFVGGGGTTGWSEATPREIPDDLVNPILESSCITILLASSSTAYTTRDIESACGLRRTTTSTNSPSSLAVFKEGDQTHILPADNAVAYSGSISTAGAATTAGLIAVASHRTVGYQNSELKALTAGTVFAAIHSPLYIHHTLPTANTVGRSTNSEAVPMPPLIDRAAAAIFINLLPKRAAAFHALELCSQRLLSRLLRNDAIAGVMLSRIVKVVEASLYAAGPVGARFPLTPQSADASPEAGENFGQVDYPHGSLSNLLLSLLSSLFAASLNQNGESVVESLLFSVTRIVLTALGSTRTALPARGGRGLLEVYMPCLEAVSMGLIAMFKKATSPVGDDFVACYYRFVVSGVSALLMRLLQESQWCHSDSPFPAFQRALTELGANIQDEAEEVAESDEDDEGRTASPRMSAMFPAEERSVGSPQSGGSAGRTFSEMSSTAVATPRSAGKEPTAAHPTRQRSNTADGIVAGLLGPGKRPRRNAVVHPSLYMVDTVARLLHFLQRLSRTVRHLWLPIYADDRLGGGPLVPVGPSITLRQLLTDLSHLLVNGRTSQDLYVNQPHIHHPSRYLSSRMRPNHAAAPELLPAFSYALLRPACLVTANSPSGWRGPYLSAERAHCDALGSRFDPDKQRESAQRTFATTIASVRSSLVSKVSVSSPRLRTQSQAASEVHQERIIPALTSALVGVAASVCEKLCPSVLPTDENEVTSGDHGADTLQEQSWLYVGTPKAPCDVTSARTGDDETALLVRYVGGHPTASAITAETSQAAFHRAFISALRRVSQEAFMIAAAGEQLPYPLPPLPTRVSANSQCTTQPDDIPGDALKALIFHDIALRQFLWPATPSGSHENTLILLREVEQALVLVAEECDRVDEAWACAVPPTTSLLWDALRGNGGLVDPGGVVGTPSTGAVLSPFRLTSQLQAVGIIPDEEVLVKQLSEEERHNEDIQSMLNSLGASHVWSEAAKQGPVVPTGGGGAPTATHPTVVLHVSSESSCCHWYDPVSRCMVLVKRIVGQATPIRVLVWPMLGVPSLDAPWAPKFQPRHIFQPASSSVISSPTLGRLRKLLNLHLARLEEVQTLSPGGTADSLSSLAGVAATQFLKAARPKAPLDWGPMVRQLVAVAAEHQWVSEVVPAVKEAMKSVAGVHSDLTHVSSMNTADRALYNSVLELLGGAPAKPHFDAASTPESLLAATLEPMSALLFTSDTSSKPSDRSSGTSNRMTSLDACPGGLVDCSTTSAPLSKAEAKGSASLHSGHSMDPPGAFVVPHELRKDTKRRMLAGGGANKPAALSVGVKGLTAVGLNVPVKDESRLWHDHIQLCVGSLVPPPGIARSADEDDSPDCDPTSAVVVPYDVSDVIGARLISAMIQTVCAVLGEHFIREASALDERDDAPLPNTSMEPLFTLHATRNPFNSSGYILNREAGDGFTLMARQGAQHRQLFVMPAPSARSLAGPLKSARAPQPSIPTPEAVCNATLDYILCDFDCGAYVHCSRQEDSRHKAGLLSLSESATAPAAPLSFDCVHTAVKDTHVTIVSNTLIDGLLGERRVHLARQRSMSEASCGDNEAVDQEAIVTGGIDSKSRFRSRATSQLSAGGVDVGPAIAVTDLTSPPEDRLISIGGESSEQPSGASTPATVALLQSHSKRRATFARRGGPPKSPSKDAASSDTPKDDGVASLDGESMFWPVSGPETRVPTPHSAPPLATSTQMSLQKSVQVLTDILRAQLKETASSPTDAVTQYMKAISAHRGRCLTLSEDAAPWETSEGSPFHDALNKKMGLIPQLLWTLLPAVYAPAMLFSTSTTLSVLGEPEGVAGVASPNHGVDPTLVGLPERILVDAIHSNRIGALYMPSRCGLPFTHALSSSWNPPRYVATGGTRRTLPDLSMTLGSRNINVIALVSNNGVAPTVSFRAPIGPIVHGALYIQATVPNLFPMAPHQLCRPQLSHTTVPLSGEFDATTSQTLLGVKGMGPRRRSQQLLVHPKAEVERAKRVSGDVASRLTKKTTQMAALLMQCGFQSGSTSKAPLHIQRGHSPIYLSLVCVGDNTSSLSALALQAAEALRSISLAECCKGTFIRVVAAPSRKDGLRALDDLSLSISKCGVDDAKGGISLPARGVYVLLCPHSRAPLVDVLTVPSWSLRVPTTAAPKPSFSESLTANWAHHALSAARLFIGGGVQAATMPAVSPETYYPALALLMAAAPNAPRRPPQLGHAPLVVEPAVPSFVEAATNELTTALAV